VVAVAGGTPDNVVKVFWMHNAGTGRAALNDQREDMFPDSDHHPRAP
jgi:hypothetical protein